MLKAESIHKSYGQLHILKGVDLEVKKGEIVTIVGASGAGKSSLLNILGTLDRPDSGKIYIDDIEVSKLNNKNLSAFRNHKIGFIFQFHHLLVEFDALENVCIPAFIAGKSKQQAEKKSHRVIRIAWPWRQAETQAQPTIGRRAATGSRSPCPGK
jgi:lipoprotein-releasing system ATP-binding protein